MKKDKPISVILIRHLDQCIVIGWIIDMEVVKRWHILIPNFQLTRLSWVGVSVWMLYSHPTVCVPFVHLLLTDHVSRSRPSLARLSHCALIQWLEPWHRPRFLPLIGTRAPQSVGPSGRCSALLKDLRRTESSLESCRGTRKTKIYKDKGPPDGNLAGWIKVNCMNVRRTQQRVWMIETHLELCGNKNSLNSSST